MQTLKSGSSFSHCFRGFLSTIEVLDDGIGIDFRIASTIASPAWAEAPRGFHGGKSPGGRPRIGYKGIWLSRRCAVCGALHVETKATRPHRSKRRLQRRNRIASRSMKS